ncbi:MAG: PspC domain-containing protein [Bacteroidales bacterium]|nr:PspC domain-containing protein [Bacteroidales bacterium]
MKLTENINLANRIFTIDQDALVKLEEYLKSVEHYFNAKEEATEIVADIENRIAELFETMLNKKKEVISMEDVNKVIEIIGLPEIFMEDVQNEQSTQNKRNFKFENKTKKLYRDPDNSIISGVCGGLGTYFNVDPVLFRVLFILTVIFSGIGLLLYIVLWIVMPEAKTLEQKMEMKGY